jgi:hypothetical protein
MADASTTAIVSATVALAGLALTVGGGIFVFGRTAGTQGQKLTSIEERANVAHARIDRTNERVEIVGRDGQSTAKEVAGLTARMESLSETACETRDLVRTLVEKQIGSGSGRGGK